MKKIFFILIFSLISFNSFALEKYFICNQSYNDFRVKTATPPFFEIQMENNEGIENKIYLGKVVAVKGPNGDDQQQIRWSIVKNNEIIFYTYAQRPMILIYTTLRIEDEEIKTLNSLSSKEEIYEYQENLLMKKFAPGKTASLETKCKWDNMRK
jgi:hypothetical protein